MPLVSLSAASCSSSDYLGRPEAIFILGRLQVNEYLQIFQLFYRRPLKISILNTAIVWSTPTSLTFFSVFTISSVDSKSQRWISCNEKSMKRTYIQSFLVLYVFLLKCSSMCCNGIFSIMFQLGNLQLVLERSIVIQNIGKFVSLRNLPNSDVNSKLMAWHLPGQFLWWELC